MSKRQKKIRKETKSGEMKKNLLGLIVSLITVSCASQKYVNKNFEGTYSKQENHNTKLIFSGTNFSFVDLDGKEMASFTCCDTITVGKWRLSNNLIVLSTPQFETLDSLDLKVSEEANQFKDTLYFHISNPVEEHYANSGGNYRDIYYKIYLKARNSPVFDRYLGRIHKSNIITIVKPKDISIENFSISINTMADFGGRNIGIRNTQTKMYFVNDKDKNIFNVDIPQLTYEFLSYTRLNDDFIRIVNDKKLEWDGHFYIKE